MTHRRAPLDCRTAPHLGRQAGQGRSGSAVVQQGDAGESVCVVLDRFLGQLLKPRLRRRASRRPKAENPRGHQHQRGIEAPPIAQTLRNWWIGVRKPVWLRPRLFFQPTAGSAEVFIDRAGTEHPGR